MAIGTDVKAPYYILGADSNYHKLLNENIVEQIEGVGRRPATAYEAGDVVASSTNSKVLLLCTQTGTTAETDLNIASKTAGEAITDGTVGWKLIQRYTEVLPIANGGTGANTISAACKALGLDWEWFHRYGLNYVPPDVTNNGWNSLGLCLIYYTGVKIKHQPSPYGQLLNIPANQDDVSTQIWIEQDSGALYFRGGNGSNIVSDEVFTRVATEEDVSSAGYGIVAAHLAQNGYVKFANGLILQWGNSNETYRDNEVTFPIAFKALYSVVGGPKSSGNLTGSNSNFSVKNQNNTSFIANMYDNGRGYAGFNWCAFGRA